MCEHESYVGESEFVGDGPHSNASGKSYPVGTAVLVEIAPVEVGVAVDASSAPLLLATAKDVLLPDPAPAADVGTLVMIDWAREEVDAGASGVDPVVSAAAAGVVDPDVLLSASTAAFPPPARPSNARLALGPRPPSTAANSDPTASNPSSPSGEAGEVGASLCESERASEVRARRRAMRVASTGRGCGGRDRRGRAR